jgi:hypothetical protein
MNNSELAQQAYDFLNEFKHEIQRQINHLNATGNGDLQDGFNSVFLEDGWVTLKGCSWGFVMHFDEPVRLDMTFGPDQPFVGHRHTFISEDAESGLCFRNPEFANEVFSTAEQLAHYGLRKLAGKVGDGWLFDGPLLHIAQTETESPQFHSAMHSPCYFAGRETYE